MTRFIPLFTLMLTLLSSPLSGWSAGFGINATRLIYPEGKTSIDVTVRNTLIQGPYLVRATLSGKQDEHTVAPFSVTPPLFRLEPQSTNQIRISFNGATLPSDRESVFYFHATAIPTSTQPDSAQQRNDIQAQMRFGVGSIIKLFYRPASLSGSPAAAQKGLKFSRVVGGVKVSNPSPYFVSLSEVSAGGEKLALDTPEALMLAPFGNHAWSVKSALATGSKVQWQTINDSGGIDAHNTALP